MNITDLRLTPVPPKNARKCGDNFTVSFKADGVPLKGNLHLMRDDGSIKKNVGKWYISAEIGSYIADRDSFGSGDCLGCKKHMSKPLMEAVKAILPAKYKLADGCLKEDNGWSLFCHHIPNTGRYKEVGSRYMGPEAVAIYLEAPAICPVHGRVKTQDTDVCD